MKRTNNTFSFDKAEDSTGFLLWQVTNLWQRKIKKALVKYNLTHSQFVLMASIHWLTLNKEEVTQITLSRNTKIDPMTTSTVLRTLQQKGYVKREEHLSDTRAKKVVLTTDGIKLIKKAVITVEEFDRQFFSSIGDKTEDFNGKLRALLK